MMDFVSAGFTVMMVTVAMNMVVAAYGIFARPSVVKKILSLVIFSDSLNVLAIAIGFRIPSHGHPSPPILAEEPRGLADLHAFAGTSVDPIPQAFVITAIVVGLAVTVFLLSLALLYHRHFGTTNMGIPLEEGEVEETV